LDQVVFLDESVRPDLLKEVFLTHQPALVFHQYGQKIDAFGGNETTLPSLDRTLASTSSRYEPKVYTAMGGLDENYTFS
jgi:hypothetical protein